MTADPIGGVFTYALDLARGVGSHGVHVVLATLGAPLTPAQRQQVRRLPNVTLEEGAFKLEWMPDPWEEVDAAGTWLLELADRHDVDLVHCNHLAHGALPFRRPVLTVVHSCVQSWWLAVRGQEAPAYYRRYRDQVGNSLRGSDAVVTLTYDMARLVRSLYGPIRDLSVIRNARAPVGPGAGHGSATAKEPFVFTAGRVWDMAKNVAAVVRAAPHLAWPVVVAGPERAPDRVTDADDEVAETDRSAVRFTGVLAPGAMQSYYRRAAIYALPARYEPFGLTVLEAAQSGCALVLGDIPTQRELWDCAAVFVPPNDDEAIAEAVQALIGDDARRTQLARAARRRAAMFPFDRFVNEYLLAWRTLHGGYDSLFDGVRLAPTG